MISLIKIRHTLCRHVEQRVTLTSGVKHKRHAKKPQGKQTIEIVILKKLIDSCKKTYISHSIHPLRSRRITPTRLKSLYYKHKNESYQTGQVNPPIAIAVASTDAVADAAAPPPPK